MPPSIKAAKRILVSVLWYRDSVWTCKWYSQIAHVSSIFWRHSQDETRCSPTCDGAPSFLIFSYLRHYQMWNFSYLCASFLIFSYLRHYQMWNSGSVDFSMWINQTLCVRKPKLIIPWRHINVIALLLGAIDLSEKRGNTVLLVWICNVCQISTLICHNVRMIVFLRKFNKCYDWKSQMYTVIRFEINCVSGFCVCVNRSMVNHSNCLLVYDHAENRKHMKVHFKRRKTRPTKARQYKTKLE